MATPVDLQQLCVGTSDRPLLPALPPATGTQQQQQQQQQQQSCNVCSVTMQSWMLPVQVAAVMSVGREEGGGKMGGGGKAREGPQTWCTLCSPRDVPAE